MIEAGQKTKPNIRKHLIFRTWKLDFYSFAANLTIEPGYWMHFTLSTGKRVFKWEYTFNRFKQS